MTIPDLHPFIEMVRCNPVYTVHLTPELERALADVDPNVWMRAAVTLCEAVFSDPNTDEDDRKVVDELIPRLKRMIAIRLPKSH
jgi:hypothetical protein